MDNVTVTQVYAHDMRHTWNVVCGDVARMCYGATMDTCTIEVPQGYSVDYLNDCDARNMFVVRKLTKYDVLATLLASLERTYRKIGVNPQAISSTIISLGRHEIFLAVYCSPYSTGIRIRDGKLDRVSVNSMRKFLGNIADHIEKFGRE